MARQLMVVFSNAAEGRDDEFNRWYDEVHAPDLLSIEGVESCQRFEVADPEGVPHRYLAIYELSRDGASVMGELAEGMGSGRFQGSDTVDPDSAVIGFWNPR
jgi:hypothetical protein